MTPRAQLFSPADASQRQAWDSFAASRPEASGYHRMAWMDIIAAAFGHRVFPLACARGDELCGILPLALVSSRLFGRFLVSLPFVNYGGLVADDSEAAHALLEEAVRLMSLHQTPSLELRHMERRCPALPSASRKVSMELPLPADADVLWRSLKDKVRNQVRKAEKAGLVAAIGREELLPEFYRVFCVNMRALGTPVYGRDLFAETLRRLPEDTRIITIRSQKGRKREGQCLAAGFLYGHGDVLEMPWASSLPEFRPLCANTMLYWETLRYGCEKGFARFDFGRSSPDSGPWRFKKQWGAHEVPLTWEYLLAPGETLPELNTGNPKYQWAIRAWKRLPLKVTTLLGPRIVRCIP